MMTMPTTTMMTMMETMIMLIVKLFKTDVSTSIICNCKVVKLLQIYRIIMIQILLSMKGNSFEFEHVMYHITNITLCKLIYPGCITLFTCCNCVHQETASH